MAYPNPQGDPAYPPMPVPQDPGYPGVQNPGYTPPNPAYAPPPQQGYPPPHQGYPPPHQGYPPPQVQYVGAPGAPPPPPGSELQVMTKPTVPGCPAGLEYLTQIDQILVHQAVELLEAFTGIETQNRFKVKNAMGQLVYYAAEESGFCTRQICGPRRGFTMHVADNFGNEVLRMNRDFKCCACGCQWFACCDMCSWEIVVESPVGVPIGYVRQECSFIRFCFAILNEDREVVLRLEGPICVCECPCCDIDFKLYTLDGTECGGVSKQWSGLVKELFTEADNFGIKFPMDLDVKVKATLMGAVFLINMMLFERNQERNNSQ